MVELNEDHSMMRPRGNWAQWVLPEDQRDQGVHRPPTAPPSVADSAVAHSEGDVASPSQASTAETTPRGGAGSDAAPASGGGSPASPQAGERSGEGSPAAPAAAVGADKAQSPSKEASPAAAPAAAPAEPGQAAAPAAQPSKPKQSPAAAPGAAAPAAAAEPADKQAGGGEDEFNEDDMFQLDEVRLAACWWWVVRQWVALETS